MKTEYRMPKEMSEAFLELADKMPLKRVKRPEKFIEILNTRTPGTGFDCGDGLETRNPLIAVMGDSVSAGYFECLDVEAGYVSVFRRMLTEKFANAYVNVYNAGVGGDMLPAMAARTRRDVTSMNPDVVIINGSLNWSEKFGGKEEYKKLLQSMVKQIQEETHAEIILLTPNVIVREYDPNDHLRGRVEAIRETAEEMDTCLADVYAIWDEFIKLGNDPKVMLANEINHPDVTGHIVYAKELMKLFE